MSKDIEKQAKKHPVLITLTTLAALAAIIRLVVKIINDTSEN